MGAIFISYRRGDSAGAAGRLFDRLEQKLGRRRVFMDVDSIEPGLDFVDVLNRHLEQCDAMLVVIGPSWLEAKNPHGVRRLDDEGDFVRMEVGAALSRSIRVIPVLVDGALPITALDLPEDLKALARRQALEIRHDRFGSDADQLADMLQKVLTPLTSPSEQTTQSEAKNLAPVNSAAPLSETDWFGAYTVDYESLPFGFRLHDDGRAEVLSSKRLPVDDSYGWSQVGSTIEISEAGGLDPIKWVGQTDGEEFRGTYQRARGGNGTFLFRRC